MQAQAKRKFTPDEYLALERAAETRSEYHDGEIFAMAGASRRHNQITRNLGGLLFNGLRGTTCEHYISDMRLKVEETGLYTYPDLAIACEPQRFEDEDKDTLLNPRLIIEVLSRSAENDERGTRFENYRRIGSLKECVFIAQQSPHVEHHVIKADGYWTMTETRNLGDAMELKSVAVTLALKDIYEGVEFDGPSLYSIHPLQ